MAGTVTDRSGRAVAGAVVRLEIPDIARTSASSDADGRYSGAPILGPVSPRTYPLVVTVSPPASSQLRPATVADSIRVESPAPPQDTTIVNVILKP